MARSDCADLECASVEPEADATFELAHAGTLQCFAELVEELGGDANELMRHVGLEPSDLAASAPRLNYRSMIDLLEYAAVRLQRPDFGMQLARFQGGGRVFGPIGVVMRNSRTFGEALTYVENHIHAYSRAASMRIEQDCSNRTVATFEILLDNAANKRQTIEQVMLLGRDNALEITNRQARVREVRFRHQAISPLSVYRNYFGCEVRFDQPCDAIVFTQDDLDAPVVAPRSQHYEIAAYFIDTQFPAIAPPMHARVRGSIMRRLGSSDCSIECIADELCLHPRTVHRRLRWEGRSFEDIRDEVRRDVAQYYLEQTDVTFTRVCEKLGYSESSCLSRSCLRWFGCCPSELRARFRAAPANELECAGDGYAVGA